MNQAPGCFVLNRPLVSTQSALSGGSRAGLEVADEARPDGKLDVLFRGFVVFVWSGGELALVVAGRRLVRKGVGGRECAGYDSKAGSEEGSHDWVPVSLSLERPTLQTVADRVGPID